MMSRTRKFLGVKLVFLVVFVGIFLVQTVSGQSLMLAPNMIVENAALDSPSGMAIYESSPMPVDWNLIQNFSRSEGLVESPKQVDSGISLFSAQGQNFTRATIDTVRGYMTFIPDLTKEASRKPVLLAKENAIKTAQSYYGSLKLIQADGTQVKAAKVVTTAKSTVINGQQEQIDVVQTVNFGRSIKGIPVFGSGSQLSIDLGNQGKMVGFKRQWNQLTPSTLKPEFKSVSAIFAEIQVQIQQQIGNSVNVKLGKPQLIYYDNNGKYVQPAYFYSADLTSGRFVDHLYGYVSALRNSPEPILMKKTNKLGSPLAAAISGGITPSLLSAAVGPTVGRYVVRNDSGDWVGDANDFYSGLNAGYSSTMPAITFGDYYWAEPRLFTTEEDYFADRWNVTLVEGHGAPWLFTTYSNYGDIVYLSNIPGYGDLAGSSMRFFIIKSCSVIPSVIDRSNWPDPWWQIFKGLREAIGFRTEMYINDDISYIFGVWCAQNYRVLDCWFSATNSCSAYQSQRSSGGEVPGYGSIIMIPGHENDTIYNIDALPYANSTGLTNWYQY